MGAPSDLADLRSQLDVETLISGVAARLAAASDQELPSAVESALEAVARFLGADRSQFLAVRAPEFEGRPLQSSPFLFGRGDFLETLPCQQLESGERARQPAG
jgi:hypothetical protein